MLTIASIVVFLSSLSFVFRNRLTQNLFRFPVPEALHAPLDNYYLAIPAIATLLAWLVVRKCAGRPGPNPSRYWAFSLAAISAGITVYGLVDRFLIGNERGNPLVHGMSAAALMAVLTLLPRLKKVFPYDGLVLHVAMLSMAIVLLVGIPAAWFAGESIIAYERARVENAALRVKELAAEVNAATDYNWATMVVNPAPAKRQLGRMRSVTLVRELPDTYVWQAAKILQKDAELTDAIGNLATEVAAGLSKPTAPRLKIPHYRMDASGEKWEVNSRFADAAAIAAGYYGEVKRLMDELDVALALSPAAGVLVEAKQGYTGQAKALYAQFDRHWVATASAPRLLSKEENFERASILHAADTLVQPAAVPMGDFAGLKQLSWDRAQSMTRERGSCSDRRTEWDQRVRREVPDPEYPGDPSKVRIYWDIYHYHRVECYAYEVTDEKPGVDISAQIDLTYKTDANVALPPASRPPVQASLYLYVPGGQQRDGFMRQAMQDLAATAEKIDGTPPRNLSGNSPANGFAGKGYTASRQRTVELPGQAAAIEIRIQ